MSTLAERIKSARIHAKLKSEYEKQIDALPMPTTEAGRLQQCQNFSRDALLEMPGNVEANKNSSLFEIGDYSRAIAVKRRMVAMKCTRAERQPWNVSEAE